MRNHAVEIAERNVSSSLEMAYRHPGLEKDSFEALARTIERLQADGIRVVLFTPPYHEKYNLYFEKEGLAMINHMKESVDRLTQMYGVGYYDYSTDPEISIYPELFYNSDHLSLCGQRVFTEKLREAMLFVDVER